MLLVIIVFLKYMHYHKHLINYIPEIIKLAKGDNESQLNRMTQIEQDTFEMQVRAANIGNNKRKHSLYCSTIESSTDQGKP